MRDAQAFNVLLVTSLQPDDYFGFRECTILFISASVIGIIFMVSLQEMNLLELRQHLLSLFVECLILQ